MATDKERREMRRLGHRIDENLIHRNDETKEIRHMQARNDTSSDRYNHYTQRRDERNRVIRNDRARLVMKTRR